MANSSTMDEFCGTTFWSSNLTWYTEDPDLTPCFQKTVLVWVPCIFLWTFSVFEVFYILNSKKRDIPWNFLNILKSAVTALLIILTAVDLITAVNGAAEIPVYNVHIYTPLIKIFTFALSAVFLIYNKKHGLRTSGLLFLFWFLLAVVGIVQFRSEIRQYENQESKTASYGFVSYIIYYCLVLLMFLLNCFADQAPRVSKYAKVENPCPEEGSSFLSRLLFAWFDSLAWTGFRKPLETKDLWAMNPEDCAPEIVPLFDKYWRRTVEQCGSNPTQASFKSNSARVDFQSAKKKKQASILPALCKAFGPTFMFGAFLKLLQDLLTFVSPEILKLLISFIDGKQPMWKGYLYAVLMLITAMIQTLILSQYFNRMFLVGLRIRTALISAIYRKSMCMSNSARKESTVGEIVNLMSVDAQRFIELTAYLNMIWSAPLQIALALYFLWNTLGPSVLAGLAVMIFLIPINGYIANKVKTLQIRQMKNKDERVKLMNEVLSGIKVLKLYAWEPSFEAQILKIRNKEIKVLKQAAYMNAATSFIWSCAPFLVILVSFGTYVFIDSRNVLTAQVAFVSLAYFGLLNFVCVSQLPALIVCVMQVTLVTFATYVFIDSRNVLTAQVAFVSLAYFGLLNFAMSLLPLVIVLVMQVSLVTFAVYVIIDDANVLTPSRAFVALTLFGIIRMPMSMLPMVIVFMTEVSLVSFATYVLVDETNVLDAEKAFVSLSLFNILRFPLSMLPMMISNMVQASVSIQRINKFMNSEELNPDNLSHDPSEKYPLVIENGTFTWGEEPILRNINLHFPKGDLTAVVGSVGSGKSSLISAFLGEMDKQNGRVNTVGSVAYVSQQAWIQNATLQDNILFGKSLDRKLYDRIIEACSLKPDLDMLPGGDQTEIGEKGINLSGGQKQRVSLARAVYNDADVYFFDDPLSAVDSHVGKHIFENVLGPDGILKKKTRVLVTHGITYLPECNNIVVLKNGEVSEMGNYKELLDKKGDFADFLIQHLQEVNEDEAEEQLDELKSQLGTDEIRQKLARHRSRVSESVSETGSTAERMNGSLTRQMSSDSGDKSGSLRRRIAAAGGGGGKEEIKKPVTGEKLIEAEKTETGSVKWEVYKHYLKSIGVALSITTVVLNMVFQGFSIGSNLWLAVWSDNQKIIANGTTVNTSKRDMYLGVYGALGVGQVIAQYFCSLLLSIGGLKAAETMHNISLTVIIRSPSAFFDTTPVGRILSRFGSDVNTIDMSLPQHIRQALLSFASFFCDLAPQLGCWFAARAMHLTMLAGIMRAPLVFFDTTPQGRILARFSKDIDVLDTGLPQQISDTIYCCFEVVATLFVISYTTPIFVAVIVPIGFIYYFIQRFYVASSRQLKRLESVSRSPIYSHFGESVTGTQTIRAYGVQNRFISESEAKVDFNQVCYYPSIIANRWLAVRLEMVGNMIIFFAALFAVINKDTMNPGLVGLSVSYALQITQTLNWLVRMTSEVETNIVAVERIKEYGETQQEAPWELPNSNLKPTWPESGMVQFRDYAVRYRPGLDLILKGVNFTVNGGEKVGIVGRTGAGKSSLTLGLFRIIEAANGAILIDDVNIAQLGLHALRSRLTIIPQDAVLFSGTLRINLDPFDTHTDEEVWRALEHAHLKTFVKGLPSGLNHEVTEGGENLSVGQRQLICLGRALLRKTKVLVLDEATAAVDLETDDLIQRTIRTEFNECTVLTIAHRLNTIMDSDRVIVLDRGQIVEFDAPNSLLQDKNSIFYGMAKDAGLV